MKEMDIEHDVPPSGKGKLTRGSSRAGYRGEKKNMMLTPRDREAMDGEIIAEWERVRSYESDSDDCW
jgi:hypothetical protein